MARIFLLRHVRDAAHQNHSSSALNLLDTEFLSNLHTITGYEAQYPHSLVH